MLIRRLLYLSLPTSSWLEDMQAVRMPSARCVLLANVRDVLE